MRECPDIKIETFVGNLNGQCCICGFGVVGGDERREGS